jgi:hypothetical protein
MPTKTSVVNIHHKVPFTRYCGRGSNYGNPFSHLENTTALYKVATRDEAIERYREWAESHVDIEKAYRELDGEVLACFCKPQRCHCDILIELIEEYKKSHGIQTDDQGGAK